MTKPNSDSRENADRLLSAFDQFIPSHRRRITFEEFRGGDDMIYFVDYSGWTDWKKEENEKLDKGR